MCDLTIVRVGFVAVGLLLGVGCGREGAKDKGAAVPAEEVLARIDGEPITRADLQQQVADKSVFVRTRYAAPEKRKELLDSLIRFEVLAREAEKRGYARDPDVIRYGKQKAIDRMLAAELEAAGAGEVSATEVEAYYRAHPDEFRQAPAIRLDQIVVKDEAKARRLWKFAELLPTMHAAKAQTFRGWVAEHSEDEDSKQRGGDTTFLERDSTLAPRAVIDAGFALAGDKPGPEVIGRTAGPIASERGYHIIRLTAVRPGFLRPFEEVEPRVRARVLEERRRKRIEGWVAEMRGRVKVEIFADRLGEIKVGTNPAVVGQDAAPAQK